MGLSTWLVLAPSLDLHDPDLTHIFIKATGHQDQILAICECIYGNEYKRQPESEISIQSRWRKVYMLHLQRAYDWCLSDCKLWTPLLQTLSRSSLWWRVCQLFQRWFQTNWFVFIHFSEWLNVPKVSVELVYGEMMAQRYLGSSV